MKRFEDKVALVTGGRTGIGRAIVERLQEEGARVITVQRKPDSACEHIVEDLAIPEAAQDTIRECISIAGKLDVLINNAGIMQESAVEDLSFEDWQRCLALNLTTPFMLIKYGLPFLRKNGGAIVNIGSIEGIGANPNHAAYCASKAGLHGLTRAVAVDHGKNGVRCNAVAPGWIDTDLNEEFINAMSDEKFRQNIADIHPVGRTGLTQDVAALVAFLAAPESAFITGQVYTIDGGRMAQLSLP